MNASGKRYGGRTPLNVIVCQLIDDVAGSSYIGVGRTREQAMQDAATHHDQSPGMVQSRLKARTIRPLYFDRKL